MINQSAIRFLIVNRDNKSLQVTFDPPPWYASIGDNTLADAILDRLMHNVHCIQLKGKSMRKNFSQLTDGEHLG